MIWLLRIVFFAVRGSMIAVTGWACWQAPLFSMVWVALALLAWRAPAGWLGLIAPASILFLLLRESAFPPTEGHLLRTRGQAYRRYQQTTRSFFPWPARRRPSAPTA